MLNTPLPGQIYKHFKGNLYRVITLAEHSETGDVLVIYQALYGEYQVYARPLSMFMEKIDRKKYPNVVSEYRFELQKELVEAPVQRQPEEEASQAPVQKQPEEEELQTPVRKKSEEASQAPVQRQPEEEEAQAPVQRQPEEGESQALGQESSEEIHLDPLVLEFLDANTCERRLNILSALHDRITDDMINIMAICAGVEIEDGDTEERFEELRTCLITMGRYENRRLR